VAWLLDGALQVHPFMLGRGFAEQVISPAGSGQPPFVAVPGHRAARLIAAHPMAWDIPFALIQLLTGLGLLHLKTASGGVPWPCCQARGSWRTAACHP
jgi:hypothetical protein